MDFCRNVTLSGEYYLQDHRVPASPPVSGSKLDASLAVTSPLDDLFPAQNTEGDVSLEWLSVFVEDCLSSTGNCALPAPTLINVQATTPPKPAETLKQKPQQEEVIIPTSFQKFIIPVKARSKRKRVTSVKTRRNPLTSCWSYCPSSDPPLLQQTHWLADSELIVPNEGITDGEVQSRKEEHEEEEEEGKVLLIRSGKAKDSSGIFLETNNDDDGVQQQRQQPRRCTHCLSQRTPQWRAGPLGPKTLCNACGVRYKSGRLLPEYRPAKSPTFVSYLHSNSHKKVMEMRMATSSLFKS